MTSVTSRLHTNQTRPKTRSSASPRNCSELHLSMKTGKVTVLALEQEGCHRREYGQR